MDTPKGCAQAARIRHAGGAVRLGLVVLCSFGLVSCAGLHPVTGRALPPPPPLRPAAPAAPHGLAEAARLQAMKPIAVAAVRHPPTDLTGRSEIGRASFYAARLRGRRTADGQRFNPRAAVAASKTLPLGTVARVVNLTNGASATITVDDRGPFVPSRMLDVSPAVAVRLGMLREGVARVLVEPIAIPEPDGKVRLGAGAALATPAEIHHAVLTSRQIMRRVGPADVNR
ncbi:MAG: hypothetical protein B7Z59_06025 [Acidiphilium sp. 37-67-22]|nr:MAG: hypothetical protein B7X09_02440 [Acidiphilium sp. 21-66-27]OYW10862.1 MAG: hypothetical protein B7Z59_06025 [Acidiphilium sp. 37-67-22]